MFKMSTIHANTCIQTTMPLRNRCRDDGVHGPAVSTPSANVLSTPSHHGSANGRPSLEAYPRCCSPPDSNLAFRWPHLWRNKLASLALQHGDMCHVNDVLVPHLGNLAEKRSNPRKQSGYPAEAYLAEPYSGNSHR